MKAWWERWPHVLNDQLQALEKAGIKYSIKEKNSKNGSLVLCLDYLHNGKKLELEATFPDLFPYFRFEVKGLNLDLPRHQNPFQKNLCLIGRSTLNWNIDDTLADYIVNRIPLVMTAALSAEPLPKIEEIQGEPVSSYYRYHQDLLVLFDSSWLIDPTVTCGSFKLGISGHLHAVLEVRDSSYKIIARLDDRLVPIFEKQVECEWVRCPEAIKEFKPKDFRKKLFKLHPHLTRPKGKASVIGVLFPEEVADREVKDGWVFLLQDQWTEKKNGFREKKFSKISLIKSGRAGQEDMQSRIPEVSHLKDKKIALFGLGCLGASSALEFARCGVGELRVLDYDIVEPGTIVRWPLGLQAAGKHKIDAITAFIEVSYPYTKVVPVNMKIGEARVSQRGVIEDFMDDVDLIYDATAEQGVQSFLSDIAYKKGIPYICISTTYGAWGGIIARILPDKEGCWQCLKYCQDQDEESSYYIPVPRMNEEGGEVQPEGCADPTFTGTSFDGGYIALAGVRLAASTLSAGEISAYPAFDWDVAIINLRDEDGNAITPDWNTTTLKRHPSCPCHGTSPI